MVLGSGLTSLHSSVSVIYLLLSPFGIFPVFLTLRPHFSKGHSTVLQRPRESDVFIFIADTSQPSNGPFSSLP